MLVIPIILVICFEMYSLFYIIFRLCKCYWIKWFLTWLAPIILITFYFHYICAKYYPHVIFNSWVLSLNKLLEINIFQLKNLADFGHFFPVQCIWYMSTVVVSEWHKKDNLWADFRTSRNRIIIWLPRNQRSKFYTP